MKDNELDLNAALNEASQELGMEDLRMPESDQSVDTTDDSDSEQEVEQVTTEEPAENPDSEQEEVETTAEAEEREEPDYDEPAPARWPSEMKEAYNALPPTARQALMEQIYKPMQRRYTDVTTNLQKQQEQMKPLMDAMEQHREVFERHGRNPVEATRDMLMWSAHIAQNGAPALAEFNRAFGFDPNSDNGQQEEEYLTPFERQIREQNQQLANDVSQLKDSLQKGQESQQQSRQAQLAGMVRQELANFHNEKTDDGNPAHPHFEKVAKNMMGLMQAGMVKGTDDMGQPLPFRARLAQAYDMACRMDTSIAPASSASRKGQVAKAKAAQNVGVGTTSRPGARPETPVQKSLDEELDSLYGKLRKTG